VRFDNNVPRTFAVGSSICGSGYYHGVLERSLVTVKSRQPETLAPVARRLCRGARAMTPWIQYQCLHGLGHGLMIATGLNLPISLAVCKRLERWWDRDACRTGVFMENLQSSYGFTSTWLRDDDPIYPCDRIAFEARRRCYQMVTSRILPFVGNDWDETAVACTRVEAAFSFMCFRSFGRDASSRSNRDPARIVELCDKTRAYRGEHDCVYGASQDIASNFTSGARAAELCDVLRPDLRASCFTGLGSVTGRFRKTEAARLGDCRALTADPQLVDACIRGAQSALPRA